MKTKNFRNIEDEDPDDPWYPPNYIWNYSGDPKLTKKMWNDMDNNLKTGLRNFKINNCDSMGRYGMWPDWERIPQATREQYSLTKYGKSYTNPWKLWKQYVGYANFPVFTWNWGRDIIDPSERNKIYGLANYPTWYYSQETHQYERWTGDILPTSSPYSDPWGVFPPWMVREESYLLDGMRLTIDPEGYEEYVYCQVSRVCRTIKSRRN